MKISLGADHRGFKYKETVKSFLTSKGIESIDFGTHSEQSADYPDFGIEAAAAVAKHDVDFGIIICGSGNGMVMAANKVSGIRAGLAINVEMAKLARAHNDANVLVLSDMFTPEELISDIVNAFLNTQFEGGRHARRVNKIKKFEQG